jgi:hypothetical protein
MVHLGLWRGKSLTLSLKPNCITISLESNEVYSYDLAGRLWTGLKEDVSYRRGLDGKIIAKWMLPSGERNRRWLSPAEAGQLIDHAAQFIEVLVKTAESGELAFTPQITSAGLHALTAAAHFTAGQAALDAAAFRKVYMPVGILPPDQYMALVLQATEGCSFNACTFCDFYRDRPFRIKSAEELHSHIQAVTAYLGEGFSLRRTVFLGDANALVTPMRKLIPQLKVVNQAVDVQKLGGIFAFLDGFSGEKKHAADYAELKAQGLERIYIGMESGSPQLLSYLNKPGRPEDVLHAVQAIKAGGVAVGIICLLGAGGQQYAQDHVRDTISLINAMPLDLDDIIYFSELVENENLPYVQSAYQNALIPLSAQERIDQGDAIERNLKFSAEGGTPHISRYDIREFVY